MRFELDEALQVLDRTPATLRALLADLAAGWLHGNYGPDTFSPFDVVGHLIAGERSDWLERARIILAQGTSVPFAKYDRYAQFEQSAAKTMAQLLDDFTAARAENLAQLRAMQLTHADLARRGMHPALGEVTLEQLLATWVAHDLNHLAQIAKAMATQYEHAVGPWRDYLGVLRSPTTRMDADGAARRAKAHGAAADTH